MLCGMQGERRVPNVFLMCSYICCVVCRERDVFLICS